jgi:hypothetical protein
MTSAMATSAAMMHSEVARTATMNAVTTTM